MKPAVKVLPDGNFYSRGYHILFYVDIPAPSLAFKLFAAVNECAQFCSSFRVSLVLWVLKEAHLVLNCFEWNQGRTLTSNLNLLILGRLGASGWLVRVVWLKKLCELLFSPHSRLNFCTPPGVFPSLSHTVIQPVLFLPVLSNQHWFYLKEPSPPLLFSSFISSSVFLKIFFFSSIPLSSINFRNRKWHHKEKMF